jgi:prepilin-type N-terminal cleavage/methylation domain-containing protein
VQTSKTPPPNAGLTLVEVLTAISIMGVITAIAATNFTAMQPSFRTRAAALEVAGDLNQARMSAVKEGVQFQLNPIAGGYQVRRSDGAGGWTVLKQVVLGTEYPHVTFGHTGVTNDPYGLAIAASSPAAAITFQSDGSVQNAGGFFLEASGYDGPVQQAVTLSSAGRVRVWKHVGASWR